MIPSNPYRPWSLRPEELLIESARDRLVGQEAFDAAAALNELPQPSRVNATTPIAIRSVLASLGHCLDIERGPFSMRRGVQPR